MLFPEALAPVTPNRSARAPATQTAPSITFFGDTVWAPTPVLPGGSWPCGETPPSSAAVTSSASCPAPAPATAAATSPEGLHTARPLAPLPPMGLCAHAQARGPAPSPALWAATSRACSIARRLSQDPGSVRLLGSTTQVTSHPWP